MRVLRILGLLLAAPVAAESVELPYPHTPDLRGVRNMFHIFRAACLDQPVSPGLGEALAPEGYSVVTQSQHWELGEEMPGDKNISVVTKTGTEEADWATGAPFIRLVLPREGAPFGRCETRWKMAWENGDPGAGAYHLYGIFDIQLSNSLQAFLVSAPESYFLGEQKRYDVLREWMTWCWEGRPCTFKALLSMDLENGIKLDLTREWVDGS